MADIKEAIRRLIFEYVSEGADKVMQTQEAVAASTTKTDKASLSLEKAFGGLERRYVETVRHQQDYAKVQEKVNAAVAQNPALQERANVVLAAASQHFDNAALKAEKGGIAASFLSKAFTTIIGPAGLIGIALTAAGVAITYVVEKFQLIPQALEWVRAALAGVGFGEAAQKLGEYAERMREVTAAAEAQKAALQAIQDLHPRISADVAKQLQLQEAQLNVAQARGEQEKIIAQEKADIVKYLQQELTLTEATLLAAGNRKIAEEAISEAIERRTERQAELAAAQARAFDQQEGSLQNIGVQINNNTAAMGRFGDAAKGAFSQWAYWETIADAVENRMGGIGGPMGPSQFKAGGYSMVTDPLRVGPPTALQGRVPETTVTIGGPIPPEYQAMLDQFANELNVSSPAAIQKSFEDALRVFGTENLGPLNRLIEVADPAQQASLIQQAVDYIRRTDQPSLAREEKINTLNDKLEQLSQSTDSLNTTIQGALSPFYSQDPRTTKLGFRAGVVGNPDWMTGAGNADPLVAVLGRGATAPGMAGGGSFTVGGGYSANDNRMAVFPVASGEEVVVNRNKGGRGGQVVNNIDNRIIVTGSIDADALSKMKVSRYQQSQRMSRGLARA